jgi:polyphosphate kinase
MTEQPTQESISAIPRGAPEADRPARSDLDDPALYTNRELSWLSFNDRVLQLVEDTSVPLLERVKFAAIHTSNLDEFFMIRVAGVHDQVDAGVATRGRDGRTPNELLDAMREEIAAQLAGRRRSSTARCGPRWRSTASASSPGARPRPSSAPSSRPLPPPDLPRPHAAGRGLGRPFPYISNLSLSLAVLVRDPVNGHSMFARVKVPKEILPRLVPVTGEGHVFVRLEELIEAHLDTLFPGMEILDTGVFRVTRDADFEVSDEADDLLRAVEAELRRRRFGEVVRVELDASMPAGLREALTRRSGRAAAGLRDRGDARPEDLWAVVKLPASTSCATRRGRRSPSRACSPGRTARATCSGRCAAGTSSSTTRTTRSPRAWSASSSRPWPTPTCWRSR